MTRLQTRLRLGTLALSAVMGASAVALAVLAAIAGAWFVLGFEAVVVVAAIIGLMFGCGRFTQAPPMTLTLLAGTVGLCSLLGYLSTGSAGYQVGPLPMKLALAARLGLAGLLALGAAASALDGRVGLWARAAMGALLVAAPTAIVGAAFSDIAAPLVERVVALGAAVVVGACAAGFLVWVGLVSAGGHMIITSFERALPAPWEKSADPTDGA